MQITLSKVVKSFPQGKTKRVVLNGIDLKIAPGESIGITGPSGSGKSTLLNLLGLLDTPTDGQVLFDDRNSKDLNSEEQCALRNREIGFIFQLHHLLPQCTVLENVLVPTLAAPDHIRKDAPDRARQLLERVGLAGQADQFPGTLSGGELQRTAVVRALINHPSVLLADEPTGALDAGNAEKMTDLLLELNRENGTALVMVSHNETLAGKMGKQYRLENGLLISPG